MCYHAKLRQNRPNGLFRFFDFQDARRPPSSILKFFNFWFFVRFGGLRCIIVPNFIQLCRKAAEILHLTIFKMAAVRHLGFL